MNSALFDTGTSFVGIPTRLYSKLATIMTQFRSDCQLDDTSNLIICEDNSHHGLPDVHISIQGSLFTLTSRDYFNHRVLGFMPLNLSKSNTVSIFILGDTFLKTYYTVFDMDQKRIGISNARVGIPYRGPDSDAPDDESLDSTAPLNKRAWKYAIIALAIFVTIILLGTILFSFCQWFVRRLNQSLSQPASSHPLPTERRGMSAIEMTYPPAQPHPHTEIHALNQV